MQRRAFFLFALGCLAYTGTATAQTLSDKGLLVGLNVTQFVGADAEPPGIRQANKQGIYAMAFLTFSFNSRFALQPELAFSMKGSIYKGAFGNGVSRLTQTFYYLEVPLLARLNVLADGRLYALTGPTLGFALSAKLKGEGVGVSQTRDLLDDIKPLDLAWMIGAGYRTAQGLTIGVRFSPSLTRYLSRDNADDIRHLALALIVGYSL